MNFTCPGCNLVFPAEAALQDLQAREAVRAALSLPAPLADRVLRYLRLFNPPKRVLAWHRVTRLLQDLLAPIAAGKLERQGRTWSAPLDYWQSGLDEILAKREKLTLPLKTHGYLFEIVCGYANKSEGASETQDIERARHPAHRAAAGDAAASADPRVRDAALGTLKKLTKGGAP